MDRFLVRPREAELESCVADIQAVGMGFRKKRRVRKGMHGSFFVVLVVSFSVQGLSGVLGPRRRRLIAASK